MCSFEQIDNSCNAVILLGRKRLPVSFHSVLPSAVQSDDPSRLNGGSIRRQPICFTLHFDEEGILG